MSTEPKQPIEASLTSPAVNLLKQIMSSPFTKDWLENMRIAKFNRSIPNCDLPPNSTRAEMIAWRNAQHVIIVSDNVRDLIRKALKNALEKELIGAIGEIDEICEALHFEP